MKNSTELFSKIKLYVERIIYWSAAITAVSIILMIVSTVADVIARYFLDKPIRGVVEGNVFLMAALFFGGIAYCQQKGSHIRVDVLAERLGSTAQTILDVFVQGLGAAFFAFITYLATIKAYVAIVERQLFPGDLVVRMPLAPARIVMVIGMFMLTLQLTIFCVSAITKLIRRNTV